MAQQAFVVARFEWAGDDDMSIIVGGGSGISNTTYSCDATGAAINGNILTGLSRATRLTDVEGNPTTLGALLGAWDTDTEEVILLRLNDGAEGYFELGTDDYITLPFSTTTPLQINIGDYVDLALVPDVAQGKQFAKRYEVCTFPKPTYNVDTCGYDYELRLDAYYMKWKNKIFRYIAQQEVSLGEEVQGEASWSLTAPLATHMAVFLRNLTSLGYTYGGTSFAFTTSNYDHDVDKARLCTYSEMNMIDALSTMADTFECEWWVEDNNIVFGKCEHSDLMQVQIGQEAETMSRTDSSGVFATRLYAFGAERNLQSDYRATADEVLINGVVQRRLMLPEDVPYVDAWRYDGAERVYTTAYKTDTAGNKVYVGDTGYGDLDAAPHMCGYKVIQTVDAQGNITLVREYVSEETYAALATMAVEETIEGVVSTDDIYPRTDDSVAQVSRYYKMFDPSVEGDSGTVVYDDIDPAFAGQTFDPDTYPLTGAQYLEVYYRVKSSFFGETFHEEYVLAGQTLALTFTAGRLNGMDFEVMFLGTTGDTSATYTSPDGTQWFELVATTTYGAQLPNDTLYPAVGDAFVLYNWQFVDIESGALSPAAQTMITAAERELLAYAIEYMWDTMVDDGVYDTELNLSYVFADGDTNTYIQHTFAVGQRILLVNDALFAVPRESRVLGYRVSLDIPYDHPTYKIGESVQYSRIGAVESKVNALTYNGNTYANTSSSGSATFYLIKTNDSVAASDRNAYSALRALTMFLRKDVDDAAAGNIIFDKNIDVGRMATVIGQTIAVGGVQFGEVYEKGLLGQGGMIDGDGVGELDALTLRKWLEVPELRYNRVTVMTGVTWQTVGGGIIESVEIDTDGDGNALQSGIITLKLEEGEYGAVAVGDLCMGIFHDFDDQYVNDDYSEDQHNGNFHFAGFGTAYFLITEILDESDNSRCRYALRGVSERWTQQHHPRAFMNFACYGNVEDTERQACKYSTTDYEIRLRDMNDWEYGQANYYYIEGVLDGFTIDGTALRGNGIYIGNGYFSGVLQEITNAPYELEVTIKEGDTLLAEDDTCAISCQVKKAWDDATGTVDRWTVHRETGDTAADTAWDAAHADFDGTIEVTYDDMFSGGNTSALLRFTATLFGGEAISASLFLRAYDEGRDAVSVLPTCSTLLFGEGDSGHDFLIYAYRGAEQVALTTAAVAIVSRPSGTNTIIYAAGETGAVGIAVQRPDTTVDVSGSLTYTVTIDGTAYTLTCGVSSVFNGAQGAQGEQGEKGDKGDTGAQGDDAVYYELSLSCDTLDYNAFANAFAPTEIVIQVVRVVGNARTAVPFKGTLTGGKSVIAITSAADDTYTYTPRLSDFEVEVLGSDEPAYTDHITLAVYPTENTAATLEKVFYPRTSFLPRIRVWDDVEDGSLFCQGLLGEQCRDIVIHPNDSRQYFVCLCTHHKSADKEPQAGTDSRYWAGMSYFEYVATNLLLADTAKIANLYVDDVFMVKKRNDREGTAIWINPHFEGMKIQRAESLVSDDRAFQDYGEWDNPTTWFHAGAVPSASDYGSAVNRTSALTAREIGGAPVGGYTTMDNQVVAYLSVSLAASAALTVSFSAFSFTLHEGNAADDMGEGVTATSSQVILRVVRSTSNTFSSYDTLGDVVTLTGDGTAGKTFTATIAAFTDTATQAGTYYYGILVDSAVFISGAWAALDGDVTVAYQSVVSGYVSQHTAEGMFIGLNSSNYARLAVKGESGAETQHTLLANNMGIDLTQQGAWQVVGGNVMPLGGSVAMITITADGSSATFNTWTFDGAALGGQYYGTGIYRVFFPAAWGDLFGTFVPDRCVVSTSYFASGSSATISVQRATYGGYWGYLNIHVVDEGRYLDVPITIRVDYMSHAAATTLTASTTTITPLAAAQEITTGIDNK